MTRYSSIIGFLRDFCVAFVCFSALFAICFVFYLQYVRHVYACELCHLQRIPYFIIIVLSSIYCVWRFSSSLLLSRHKFARIIIDFALLCLMFFVSVSSVALAIYHLAVQESWIALPATCLAAPDGALPTYVMPCNYVSFHLFSFSLAAWNLFASVVFSCVFLSAIFMPFLLNVFKRDKNKQEDD